MRIKRLYLKNYERIKKGCGLKEIDLYFGDKDIILLVGENGSGKTSIMDALTPYADSKAIAPGKDGIKEIELEDGMVIYKIQHYYKSSGKSHKISSFIQKIVNGQIMELNENGNVTSFKEIMSSELGIVDEYISLLRLGYSFGSFISKSVSERSKFISTFLSEISVYLKYHKKVSEDSRVLKNMIKNISSKLDIIGDPEELKSLYKRIDLELNRLNQEKDKSSAKKIYLEKSLEELDLDKVSKNDLDDKTIKGVLSNLKVLDWDTIKTDTFETLERERYNTIKNKVDSLNNSINEITNVISEYDFELEDIESKVESIDEKECNKIVDNYNSYITLKNMLNEEYGFNEEKNRPIYDKKRLFEAVYQLDGYLVAIEKIHAEFDTKSISDAIIMYSEGRNLYNEYTSTLNKIEKERTEVSKLVGTIVELTKTYERVCSNECKRPSECKVQECPLIGGNKAQLEESLFTNDKEKQAKEKIIQDLEKERDYLANCITIISKIKDVEKSFNYNRVIFEGIPFIKINFFDYIKNITDCKPWYENNDLESCTEICEMYEEYISALNNIKDLYEAYIHSINQLNSLKEFQDKIIKLNTNKNLYNSKLDNCISDLDNIKEEYDILKDIEKDKLKYLEVIQYKDNLEKLKENTKKYKELTSEIERISLYIDDIYLAISKLNKEKDSIFYKVQEYKKYKEEKKLFNKKYVHVELVKKALSTNKGIPLVYIELYLEQARIVANDLLELAFSGKYKLDKFIINDKEFRIPFIKEGGGLIEDVAKGSEGEKSIISLALSFAFIHQISSSFNIMFLDEVDGPLDKKNRKNFAYAVEKQMTIMNMEQVFIITHNDSFLNKNVGYILLKGWDMDNIKKKNIIYKY